MEPALAPIIERVMSHTHGIYIKSHPRRILNGRPQIELHFSTFASKKPVGVRTVRKAVLEMRKELRARAVIVGKGTEAPLRA
jgi:hypothetical protein